MKRIPGCKCSDRQLYEVGCDCGAEAHHHLHNQALTLRERLDGDFSREANEARAIMVACPKGNHVDPWVKETALKRAWEALGERPKG